jgi:hypothetical protein
MILMDCMWRRKAITIVICGLCGSKAGGKTMLEGYMGVKVWEVYMPNSIMPSGRIVNHVHEKQRW